MNILNMEVNPMHLMKKVTANVWLLFALFIFGNINSGHAATLIKDLGGEAGFGELSQSRNDDGSSGIIELGQGFPSGVNFFGNTFHSLYINNNGNITFNGSVGTFTPSSFPTSSYPMIAPYWGDVDTRASSVEPEFNNRVYYGYTADNKFVVTWYYVGYYSASINKLNAFQLILSDKSDVSVGDFDVEFRYEQLEWTTGSASGGSNGLGGVPAQVGFDAGDGENFYQHPDSQTANILQLINTSNIDQDGVWLFQIRNGVITEPPRGALNDVTLTLMVPNNGILIDSDSFSIEPSQIVEKIEHSEVEWFFETFNADQITDLDFELIATNLQPNETRTVITQLALTYTDANGNDVYKELGEQTIEVMSSIFDISVTTDRSTYSADQIVDIFSQISNLSQFDAATTANISIRDSSENTVADIITLSTLGLTAGEIKTLAPLQFFTGNTYVGSYQVYATLQNDEGDIVEEAIATFDIALPTVAQTSAQVTTDKSIYAPNETVAIQDRIRNPAPNAILEDVIANTTVFTPDGAIFWHEETPLPQISAQGLYDVNYNVPLAQAAEGRYDILLNVTNIDGTVRATSSTAIEVQSTELTGSGLIGTINATPHPVFKTEWLELAITVSNEGNSSVENLPVTLSIVDLDNQQVISQWTQTPLNLNVNDQYHSSEPWFANIPIGNGYAAVLTTELAGNEIILATQPIIVAEKLFSTLTLATKGRLLVLLDDAGNTEQACKALSQIDVLFRPDTALLPQDQLHVELYDEHGALLDSEMLTMSDFLNPLNENVGASTDVVLTNASADNLTISLQSALVGQSLNGQLQRLSVTHLRSGISTLHESGLFSTGCYGVETGQLLTNALVVDDIQGADELDPYGPDGSPTKITQRRFLKALLKQTGWSYTIVDTMDDYARELRTNGYSVTALFNEQLKLSEAVQRELVNAVEQGLGLLYTGYHDKRNGRIEPALGITVSGKLSAVTGLQLHTSALQNMPTSVNFNFDVKPLSAQLVGAESLAVYQQEGTASEPAITDYHYGSGQSIYMGFDVLVQATATGYDSIYAKLITQALLHIHPNNLSATVGSVVPIRLSMKNIGMTVSGQVMLTIPTGSTLIDSGMARKLDNDNLLWPFTIATKESQELVFWLLLPEVAEALYINGSIDVATDMGQLINYGAVQLRVDVTNE